MLFTGARHCVSNELYNTIPSQPPDIYFIHTDWATYFLNINNAWFFADVFMFFISLDNNYPQLMDVFFPHRSDKSFPITKDININNCWCSLCLTLIKTLRPYDYNPYLQGFNFSVCCWPFFSLASQVFHIKEAWLENYSGNFECVVCEGVRWDQSMSYQCQPSTYSL